MDEQNPRNVFLTLIHIFGGTLILGSIFYLSLDPNKSNAQNINQGLFLGIIAYTLMAVGIIIVKPILKTQFPKRQ